MEWLKQQTGFETSAAEKLQGVCVFMCLIIFVGKQGRNLFKFHNQYHKPNLEREDKALER